MGILYVGRKLFLLHNSSTHRGCFWQRNQKLPLGFITHPASIGKTKRFFSRFSKSAFYYSQAYQHVASLSTRFRHGITQTSLVLFIWFAKNVLILITIHLLNLIKSLFSLFLFQLHIKRYTIITQINTFREILLHFMM